MVTVPEQEREKTARRVKKGNQQTAKILMNSILSDFQVIKETYSQIFFHFIFYHLLFKPFS